MHKRFPAIWGSGGLCATLLVSVSGITQPSPGCHDAELASVFGKEVEDPTKALKSIILYLIAIKKGFCYYYRRCHFKFSTSTVS